jgi:hypothetical protein
MLLDATQRFEQPVDHVRLERHALRWFLGPTRDPIPDANLAVAVALILPNCDFDRLIERCVILNKPDEVKKQRDERAKYPDVASPLRASIK